MKNAFIIGGVAVVAVVIGVLFFMYSGQYFPSMSLSAEAENQITATVVSFTELAQGGYTNVKQSKVTTTRANYLITSASELSKLWEMIPVEGRPPVVDFTRNSVAAVFAGEKPTAGYEINVSKVIDAQNRIVTVTLTSPGDSCVLTESITAPYQIIEFPKTALPLTHEDQIMVVDCSQ